MNIGGWLHDLGLDEYEAAFRANAVDCAVLPKLTADDLKELGVRAVGHRRKLLAAIAELGAGTPAPHAPAERRQLTVFVCDLVGSTALAANRDPEDNSLAEGHCGLLGLQPLSRPQRQSRPAPASCLAFPSPNAAASRSFAKFSTWVTFTITMKDRLFADRLAALTGSGPLRQGLVSLIDSPWLVTLAPLPRAPFPVAQVRFRWPARSSPPSSALKVRPADPARAGGYGLFQRGERRGLRQGGDRTADRHGPSAASSAVGRALPSGAGSAADSNAGRGDGASAEDAGRPGALRAAQADAGAGVRDHQIGAGIPSMFAARPRGRARRMEPSSPWSGTSSGCSPSSRPDKAVARRRSTDCRPANADIRP